MAYIGRQPKVGNFQICDAISVVNGQAAYTMQVASVNVIPETAQNLIVSLNGVIQKPGSSYTVSGSTITFSQNLVTGDVIDFIQILGSVLDIGTPSDGTVTTVKLGGALVTPSTLDVNGNELILDADADTSIVASTDDQIEFKTGGTDRLTIKNDGIGIGVTSASAPLEVRTNLSSDTQSTPETVLTLSTKFADTSTNGAAGSGSRLEFQIPDDETNPITGAAIAGLKENGDDSNAEATLAFYISQNDTTLDEAMRITSAGNVGIGTTSTDARLSVTDSKTGTEASPHLLIVGNGYSGHHWLDTSAYYIGQNSNARSLRIYSGSNEAAGAQLSAGGTSFGTYSDERLKKDITDLTNGLNKILALRPVNFKYKSDADDYRNRIGIIAQSIVGQVDEALDETKITADDETKYYNVRYQDLIPVLVKGMQEQQTKIEELETKITALESE